MSYSTTPQSKKTLDAIWRLEKIILNTLDFSAVVQKIVDSTITELGYLDLGYQIVVLCLVDENTQTLKRISISQTEKAAAALQASKVPFHEIEIPLSYHQNALIHAIDTNEECVVTQWKEILVPAFTETEALQIQQLLEIQASLIFPVLARGKAIGAMIFSMSKPESAVSDDEHDLLRSFTDVVGLAVQNSAIYTSLEKTKKKLEVANAELQKLDTLKDEFLSMASHELKSPMNAVKNYLWMAIKKGKESPQKMDEYLNTAFHSTERLMALVNDLLDVSRIESGRVTIAITPINLTTVIKETEAIYAPQAKEKGLTLTTSIPENLMVSADDTKLREVLNNLISNAIKYTPTGSVTVKATPIESQVKIEIIDTGKGISDIDQTKLFQKFSRVNSTYKELASIEGTGLGLWIAKQFIEKMNGNIGVSSQVDHGSTFWITLPKQS